MKNIAVFVSGSGTNCENIIRHFAGSSGAGVALVVSNRSDACALVRAARQGVPSVVVSRGELSDKGYMLRLMQDYSIDFIVLAGFLPVVPDFLIEAYPRRIVNLHPALLPRFGGKGMYGRHVHEAVKAAGEKETGMTVHYVSATVDGGEIIAQFRTPLEETDTPEDIAEKEHALEMEHFPQVIENLINKL